MLLRKGFHQKLKIIFLNTHRKMKVLNVDSIDDVAFSSVAAYAPTGSGWSNYFKRLVSFLGTSRILVIVGDGNAVLNECSDTGGVEASGKKRDTKCSINCSNTFNWLTDIDLITRMCQC